MTSLHIDFETASVCELKDEGLDNYVNHSTTRPHCMAFAFDSSPAVGLIANFPDALDDFPDLFDHVANGGEVVAHNAPFELGVWNNICVPRYGWPRLDPAQVRCTMAQAYAMGLPGALDKAAAALGLDIRKDAVGQRIMMQLAKPKADGTLWRYDDAPEKFNRLYEYCKQDVVVESAIDERLMQLSEKERRYWCYDYTINRRGVFVDLASIDKALALVDKEKARLDARMLKTTGNVVGKCTEVQLLVKWIRSQGVEVNGLAKADVIDALKIEDMPPQVRTALLLRQEAARSSTAKLVAMKKRASADARVRGCFQFHGAATGRWAHRGIQPGNLPRPRPATKQKHIEDILCNLHDAAYVDAFYGPTMDALTDSIRAMITAAPGNHLIAMDFSAIEARALAWLAGQESVLDIFRTHGKIYEHAASGIYNVPLDDVTKDQRQIGKVAVLALGYGGGVGAFQSMARVYGVKVPDEQADQIKQAWRDTNRKIVQYWYDLERAAINAVEFGEVARAGAPGRQVTFKKSGSFLWCRLPSGRVLCYPYPRVMETQTPWGETKSSLTYMTVLDSTQRKKMASRIIPDPMSAGDWVRIPTYGGSLAENVTQAVAACLLREAIERAEEHGYPVVLHVHDEIVVEVPAAAPSPKTEQQVEHLMAVVPAWAKGLPLAAEGWRGFRYRK